VDESADGVAAASLPSIIADALAQLRTQAARSSTKLEAFFDALRSSAFTRTL
jgi:hypothetical protein